MVSVTSPTPLDTHSSVYLNKTHTHSLLVSSHKVFSLSHRKERASYPSTLFPQDGMSPDPLPPHFFPKKQAQVSFVHPRLV